MYFGRVDTDTKALQERIALNSKCQHNLEDWILEWISGTPSNILDIGCGTGKQMGVLRKTFPNATITGIDVSKDALKEASQYGFVLCGSMDDLTLAKGTFDLILSTYAIYYSKQIVETILKHRSKLRGEMILVGPGKMTNQELVNMVNAVKKDHMSHMGDFLREEDIEQLKESFDCQIRILHNHVTHNREEFMRWWRNHNMFMPEVAEEVERNLPDTIRLTKNVLGVKLT